MNSTPVFCASVYYPNISNEAFDLELYANTLVPEFARLMSDNCIRFEIRKGLSSPGSDGPLHICSAHFYLISPQDFGTTMSKPEMQALMGRIETFTTIQPIRQFDQVL